MDNILTPLDRVEWKKVKYLKINEEGPAEQHPYEFELILPEPLASWDVFDYWEKERTRSMRDNLKQGDVLFDIGAEHGWLSAIYAQFVGAENLVLIEPTPEFWPNIKATFEKNGLVVPRVNLWALIGDTLSSPDSVLADDAKAIGIHAWPRVANTGKLISKLAYRYLHDPNHVEQTPVITIDSFVEVTGVVPNALTMDTEGAEILILRGAEQTLRKHHPLVWASIHPDLALRDGYGYVRNVHELMERLGYVGELLAIDHEEHWLFRYAG